MQPEIIHSMHEQVRAIHRALTGRDVADEAATAGEIEHPDLTDESIARRFAELEAIARMFPSVMERVPPFMFTPLVDVIAIDGGTLLELALPGVDRDDIKVEPGAGALAISGIRRDTHAMAGRVVSAEIPRGPFALTVPLHAPYVGEPHVELDRGVLRIVLVNSEQQRQTEGGQDMTRMETNDVQRLTFAIQAAMRAVQTRNGGVRQGQEWGGGQTHWPQQPQSGTGQFDEVRTRVKESVRDRIVHRLNERVSEVVKERVRYVLRDRLETELRTSLVEAQIGGNFDFSRMEKRLCERLSDTMHDQVIESLRERTRNVIRERLVDSVRESLSGIGLSDEERIATRIRETLEPALGDHLIEVAREQIRESIRYRLQEALRERLQESFQHAMQRGASEPHAIITVLKERLADSIESRIVESLTEKLREVFRNCIDDVIRQRLDEAVRYGLGEPHGAPRKSQLAGMSWGMGQVGPSNGDGIQMVETLQRQIHESLRERFVEGLREHVVQTLRQGVEDALRERLGTAVRTSLVEQKLLGGFDPDSFADAVRSRIAYVMRERLTDGIRERLHDVHRDRLRDAIRSAVSQAQGGSELDGFGNGMH